MRGEKIFWKFPLSIVGLARGKAAIGRGRDESFPHAVGRLFRTCGVGVDLARGIEQNAAGFCPVISLWLSRRRESRRAMKSVVVMAEGYSVCVRAVLGQYIGSPWRGVPGDNHLSIPGSHAGAVHVRPYGRR